MTPGIPPPKPEEQTAIRRATKRIQLPLVSGTASAVILFLCFGASAAMVLVVGAAAHLPPWIRFEIVLVAWWLIWIATLAHFLYHGKRVSHDHEYHQPRSWLPTFGGKQRSSTGGTSNAWDGWVMYGPDGEGCLWVIGILVALVAVFALAWLLVEIVIPILALILYALIRGMLARIANDRHHCQNRFGPSLGWGMVWASVYTAPLALLVWAVHLIVAYRAGLSA
jgi:hypothetical protein